MCEIKYKVFFVKNVTRNFFGNDKIKVGLIDFSNLMIEKIIKKQSSEMQKDFKKSNLDILTEENDRLLKNLKRPSGSYRAA